MLKQLVVATLVAATAGAVTVTPALAQNTVRTERKLCDECQN